MSSVFLIFLSLTVLFCNISIGQNFPDQTVDSALFLSYSAYCGSLVTKWNCYWCNDFSSFQVSTTVGDSGSAHFGFVGIFNNTVFVSLRGTDNIEGWIQDAEFTQTSYPGVPNAMVHEGFLQDYLSLSYSIKSAVAKLSSGGINRVIVTGHSLGAALATLAAVDLAQNASLSVEVINFGSPRVGNQAFATYANKILKSVKRFTWNRDLVPQLPPRNIFQFSYFHLTEEIWWDGGSYHYCSTQTGEDKSCSASRIIPNILDHAFYLNVDLLQGIPHQCLWVDPEIKPVFK